MEQGITKKTPKEKKQMKINRHRLYSIALRLLPMAIFTALSLISVSMGMAPEGGGPPDIGP